MLAPPGIRAQPVIAPNSATRSCQVRARVRGDSMLEADRINGSHSGKCIPIFSVLTKCLRMEG